MKRLIFVVTMVLLAMVVLSTGCTKATPKTTTSNVTGVLKDINTPADPGADAVTITTPQGDKTFPLANGTSYSLEGRSCILADVGKVVDEGNQTLECTVVVSGIDPYGLDASVLAVYVAKK
jgi:hypothetical protein